MGGTCSSLCTYKGGAEGEGGQVLRVERGTGGWEGRKGEEEGEYEGDTLQDGTREGQGTIRWKNGAR